MLQTPLNLKSMEQGVLTVLQVFYHQLPLHQMNQLVILFIYFFSVLISNIMCAYSEAVSGFTARFHAYSKS